jgi:hypothetical protein
MNLEAAIANAQTRSEENAMRWDGTTLPDDAWGFFSYPDGPAALGGGLVATTWLESRAGALDFIAETLPFHPPAMASAATAESVRVLVGRIKSGELDESAGVDALNQTLKGLSQITFFGPLASLMEGGDDFARSVRSDFLDVDDGAIAIPADRRTEFKDWLLAYGV